jgi:hypothetical protein
MAMMQGLAQSGPNLFAAWKGEVGDERLFYAAFDGSNWRSELAHIPGNSSIGPSLAASTQMALHAGWKGEHGDSDQRLFYSVFDGTAWSRQVQIPHVASSVGPALGVLDGALYAAWKGEEGDTQIYWSQLTGETWSHQAPIGGATSITGPSLGLYNGQLFAGWIGVNDQRLHFAQSDGSSWENAPSIPGNPQSSIGPSLAQAGTSLYAAWKGEGDDQGLYYAVFSDGAWSDQNPIPGVASSVGPALAALGSTLYAMWKGEGDDQGLYYASFDGSWSGQKPLPGNTGQDYVAPPIPGLASSSNYWIMRDDGAPIEGPSVTITITEDLVAAANIENFGFQLNCYSPQGAEVAWQQYLIVPHFDRTSTVSCGYQGYPNSAPQLIFAELPTNESLATPNGRTIPANCVLTITLVNDANSNVIEADFSVSPNTATPKSINPYKLKLLGLPLNTSGKVTLQQVAPIVAMQLNIVGPAGGPSAAVFTSGAGTIAYTAQNGLIASRFPPTTAEVSVYTAEVANTFYTTALAGTSTTPSQSFGVRV